MCADDVPNEARLSPTRETGLHAVRDILVVRGRILVAEDNPDIQRLVLHYLRVTGAEVDIADNGRIALENIELAAREGRPYALLLTDIQMPELDGCTLASTLRARSNPIPVVAMTANAEADEKDHCLKAGCSDFLAKPIDAALLVAVCAQWAGTGPKNMQRAAEHHAGPARPETTRGPRASDQQTPVA